jgi:hypothetical protein
MDAWKENITNCTCWHPALTVRTVANMIQSKDVKMLVEGYKLVSDCSVDQFVPWQNKCQNKWQHDADPNPSIRVVAMEKIFNIASVHGYTPAMHQDICEHLRQISSDLPEVRAKILSLEQKTVTTSVVTNNCTCGHRDHGLVRAQGYTRVPQWGPCDTYPETWKPYTVSYPLLDVDDKGLLLSIQPPEPPDIVDSYFQIASQMNARIIWNRVSEQKYVNFELGVPDVPSIKRQRLYDKNFIDFPISSYNSVKLCPNSFGEYFQFYGGTEYSPNLKYQSKTAVADHFNIDKDSHTDMFRSDCSLWYTSHQLRLRKKILQYATKDNWKSFVNTLKDEIKLIEFDPPGTHKERYKYWQLIK